MKINALTGKKILIIDDDTDDVEILAEAFTQSGVESVHYVHTAMQAFMYLQSIEDPQHLPKLIVTDHYLPGMTGRAFLADLKKMDKYKSIHAIVLSSDKSEEQIEQYRLLGVQEYLIKSISYADYVKVAKEIADRVTE